MWRMKIYSFVIFSAEGEVSCKDLLTSRDKVEIIKATFAYIAGDDGLWNRFPSSLTTLNNTVFTYMYNTGLLATPATRSLSITQVVSQRQQSSSSPFLLLRRCQKKENFECSNLEILALCIVWDNPLQRIYVKACFSAHPNQSLTQNKSEACTECQVVETISARENELNI